MKLVDLPQPTEMSAYEDARAAIKEKYANVKGVQAVLEYGTVPFPGISDIDLIVIAKPYTTTKMPRMKEFTKAQRFILTHRPYIFSESTHHLLRFIDPWIIHATPLLDNTDTYDLSHVRTISKEEHYWASTRRMLHWSFVFLRFITNTRATNSFACRSFMDHSIGIKYFYRELNLMNIEEENGDPNIPFFIKIRENWFTLNAQQQHTILEEGLEKFTESLRKFLKILSVHLSKAAGNKKIEGNFPAKSRYQRKLLAQYPCSAIVDTGETIYIYQEGRDEIELHCEVFRPIFTKFYGNEVKQFLYLLPLSLSAISNNHLAKKGVISEQYRSCFFTDMDTVPIISHTAINTFMDMVNKSKNEMKNISLKELFATYGLRKKPRTLQERVRNVGDAIILWVIRSPIGKTFRKDVHHSVL